jgi:NTP pyrophosphatase (non-canonical NTP hydrolase)
MKNEISAQILYIQNRLSQSAILMQLAEESSEVSQAALKLARIYQAENPTPVTQTEAVQKLHEELADFLVSLNCLMNIDFDKIEKIEERKIGRWVERLEQSK